MKRIVADLKVRLCSLTCVTLMICLWNSFRTPLRLSLYLYRCTCSAVVLMPLLLQSRGYLIWFDLERMKGSVMDAMSEAVEGAELVLYGVSELYKESANCRLELNCECDNQQLLLSFSRSWSV